MSIEREGRFLVWRDMQHTPGIGLESEQLAACIDEARKVPFKGVFGNPAFGFREATLDVLAELPATEAIWFWEVELRNVDALYSLTRLCNFGASPKRPPIDFARLPTLKHLFLSHDKLPDTGVRSLLALESLSSWRYRSKTKTLAELPLPENLIELDINWSNVETLDGLPSLPQLRRLVVQRCRNLKSLGDLGALFPRLEHLVVAACGRVQDGEGERVARELPNLKHAYVKDHVVHTVSSTA